MKISLGLNAIVGLGVGIGLVASIILGNVDAALFALIALMQTVLIAVNFPPPQVG